MKGAPRRLLGTSSLFAFLWILVALFQLQWASTEEIFWTTFLYVLCCLPTLLYIGGHKLRIPFMPMWGLGYFLMFGMPMLSRNRQLDLSFTPDVSIAAALRLATCGAIACLLAFYSSLGKWVERLVPQVKAPWNLTRAPLIGTFLCIVGMAFNYLQKTSPPSALLGQLLFIGSQLAVIGLVTLFLLQLRGFLSFTLRIFLWVVVVPFELLLGLGTGAIYNALVILAPLLFCYSAERRRVPWLSITAVLLVCFVPFSGFKKEYRSYAWYGEMGAITIGNSPFQRGLAFIHLVNKRLIEGGLESYSVAMESAQARVSHLDLLVTVMGATPTVIPFWGGETYQTLFWTAVPRFLFPNKPEKTLGQDFGHRYGILTEEDTLTSINLPHQVIEMYINFGVWGVFIGMTLLGLLYRGIVTILSLPDSGERSLVVGCATLTGLLSLDSDLSLVIGSLIYYIPLMYVATRGFRGKPMSAEPAAGDL